MNELSQGITISVLGIGITFLALAVLIGLIHLLQFLYKPGERNPFEVDETERDENEEQRAVAIAAAWWYLKHKRAGSLGKLLERPPGKWRGNPASC